MAFYKIKESGVIVDTVLFEKQHQNTNFNAEVTRAEVLKKYVEEKIAIEIEQVFLNIPEYLLPTEESEYVLDTSGNEIVFKATNGETTGWNEIISCAFEKF